MRRKEFGIGMGLQETSQFDIAYKKQNLAQCIVWGKELPHPIRLYNVIPTRSKYFKQASTKYILVIWNIADLHKLIEGMSTWLVQCQILCLVLLLGSLEKSGALQKHKHAAKPTALHSHK